MLLPAAHVHDDARASGHAGCRTAASPARPGRRRGPADAPLPLPMAMKAEPPLCMIDRTSAKSTLISPGTAIRSHIPLTPSRSTASAVWNASSSETLPSSAARSRSLSMVMRVSTFWRSARTPCSAISLRLSPSNEEGRRDHANRECAALAGHVRDSRGGARAGARLPCRPSGIPCPPLRIAGSAGPGSRAQPSGRPRGCPLSPCRP